MIEIAKAAYLQATFQTERDGLAEFSSAIALPLGQISREEIAESTILFDDDYAAQFGCGDRGAMRAGLESTGA